MNSIYGREGKQRVRLPPEKPLGACSPWPGEYLNTHNPLARLTMSGQELNPESSAICKAGMLIKGRLYRQDIGWPISGCGAFKAASGLVGSNPSGEGCTRAILLQ
jgi:hypothetical protein